MKIKSLKVVADQESGWLHRKFGDHVAQISVETKMKMRLAVRDVSRQQRGYVTPEIEILAKKFSMPPQGVEDLDYVLGYDTDEGHQQGAIEVDEAIQEYVRLYPQDWEIVKQCLGLARQRSRHACLPRGEQILVKRHGWMDITECQGRDVFTGQGALGKRGFQQSGKADLIANGVREVWEYTLDSGATIRCTQDHRVLTVNGWMEIGEAAGREIELVRAVNRVTVNERTASDYAKSRGGQLVSWGGSATSPATWRCDRGHEWNAPPDNVWCYRYWCRLCSHAYRFAPTKADVKRAAGKCLSTYRRYDAKKGYQCDLTVDDVIVAKQSPCTYCGRASTGMERIENALGHTKANCVPACLRCNWMRGKYVSHEVMLSVGEVLKRVDP